MAPLSLAPLVPGALFKWRSWETEPPHQSSPELFQDPVRLRAVATVQHDIAQYPGMSPQEVRGLVRNSCGSAVIATTLNMFALRNGTINHHITIGEVIQELAVTQHNQYIDQAGRPRAYLQWDGRMFLYDLIHAFSIFGLHTVPIIGTEFDSTFRYKLSTYPDAPQIKPAIDAVLGQGGLLVAFTSAAGGHLVIVTEYVPVLNQLGKVQDVSMFVIDSLGPDQQGWIGATTTEQYSPKKVLMGGSYVATTGTLGLVGILP
jgi:hypothetical protein